MSCDFQEKGGVLLCRKCEIPTPFVQGLVIRDCVNDSPQTKPIDYTPADLPCQYRLAILESKGTCDQCGMKGQPFEQYGCFIHGTCSLAQRHSGVKACCRCNDSPEKNQWPAHLR